MSGLIYSNGMAEYAQSIAKSYISTKPFKLEFLTYTVSTDARFQFVGSTGYVTTTDALCPAGRILHVTGRKLYPGANVGVSKFLLSVYDPITFLNGFIDPSSSTFAKYDQNVPNFFDNGPTVNGSSIPPLGGQAGKLTLTDIKDALSVAAGGTVDAGDASVGQVFFSGTASGTITIRTTACRAGSRIIVTPVESMGAQTITVSGGGGGTVTVPMSYYVSNGFDAVGATPAYFTITRGSGTLDGASKFNWLVIN
jgi:hypothetical protein